MFDDIIKEKPIVIVYVDKFDFETVTMNITIGIAVKSMENGFILRNGEFVDNRQIRKILPDIDFDIHFDGLRDFFKEKHTKENIS